MRLLLCAMIGCVAACVLVTGCAGGRGEAGSAAVVPAEGSPRDDIDGLRVDLSTPGAAKVSVLVFTRTDCPISNRYAPEVRRLYGRFHPRGVEFFLVYVDPGQSPDAIRRHLREYAYLCRAVRDSDHELVKLFGATITPEAAVFDRERGITYVGRIDDLYVDFGRSRTEATTHDLADAIEATLQGRAVVTPRTGAVGCTIADTAR